MKSSGAIKELTYQYDSPTTHNSVDVCSIKNYDSSGNLITKFSMPKITLIDNGLTYTSSIQQEYQFSEKVKVTLIRFPVEETIMDGSVCVGTTNDCLDIKEAIEIVEKTVSRYFIFTGDLVERDLVLKPRETMKSMEINSCKGTVEVKKNDVLISFQGNEGLKLKLQATGTYQKSVERVEDKVYVNLFDVDHGVKEVDFTFTEVGDIKELIIGIYAEFQGMPIPEFKGTGDGKKYTMKTKEYISESRKLKGEDEKYKIVYFEVGNKLSGGEIAGIVIGVIIVVAGIAVGVFFVLKRKAREASSDPGAKA